MTIIINEKERKMVQYCIELVSLNTRNFEPEEEEALKNIAEKISCKYDKDVNNYGCNFPSNWIPPQA